jgi:hypothetical protein
MNRRSIAPVLLASLALLLLAQQAAPAQTPLRKPFGFGFTIGEPTALSFKARVGRSSAVDFGIGKSLMGYPTIYADYLWQFLNVTRTPRVSPYAGVGFAAGFLDKGTSFFFTGSADSSHWYYGEDISFAGRGVVGISYFLESAPVELFAELDPIIGFVPKTAFSLQGGAGARFYIGRR